MRYNSQQLLSRKCAELKVLKWFLNARAKRGKHKVLQDLKKTFKSSQRSPSYDLWVFMFLHSTVSAVVPHFSMKAIPLLGWIRTGDPVVVLALYLRVNWERWKRNCPNFCWRSIHLRSKTRCPFYTNWLCARGGAFLFRNSVTGSGIQNLEKLYFFVL